MQEEVPWNSKSNQQKFNLSHDEINVCRLSYWERPFYLVFVLWSLYLRCWQSISFSVLLEICRLFWSLAKPAQDALLWAMQTNGATVGESDDSGSEEDSDGSSDDEKPMRRNRAVKYFLNGTQVCRRAFQRMLGIGSSRLNRTRSRFQGMDERTQKGQSSFSRPALATASVGNFLQKLYWSVSESMPTQWLRLQHLQLLQLQFSNWCF